jgi:hypothetical protein
MNFYVSIMFALNICLSSSIPIAQLSAKAKEACTGADQDCVPGPPAGHKSISSNSTRNSILLQFQKNPIAFVSAMSKADPDTLRQVIGLLHQLLDTSNARETHLTNILNTKIAELGDAETDVADAQSTLNSANTALASAQAAVVASESDLTAKDQVRTTKQTEKNDAQGNHDDEIDSLNDEQAMLAQVIEILEDLLGRQGVSVEGVLVAETNQHQYFRVPVTGAMTSAAIADACVAAGYKALCSGPEGCGYNDDNCLITPEATSCSNPMHGVSTIVCNSSPSSCPEFEGLYNYMKSWNGGVGCGVENGRWCSTGSEFTDKDALCVL